MEFRLKPAFRPGVRLRETPCFFCDTLREGNALAA
jgi:hypothetical protein